MQRNTFSRCQCSHLHKLPQAYRRCIHCLLQVSFVWRSSSALSRLQCREEIAFARPAPCRYLRATSSPLSNSFFMNNVMPAGAAVLPVEAKSGLASPARPPTSQNHFSPTFPQTLGFLFSTSSLPRSLELSIPRNVICGHAEGVSDHPKSECESC